MSKYLDYLGLQELVAKVKELFEPFEAVDTTDNTTAYTKQVPVSAKGLVTFNKIGGMSYKCSNLVQSNTASTQYENNDTFVAVLQPSTTYTISFTSNASGDFTLKSVESAVYLITGAQAQVGSNSFSFTTPSDFSNVGNQFYFYASVGIIGTELRINLGSTALPYEAYYEGLHHSEVTKVESVGTNVWDEQWELANIKASNGSTYYYKFRSKNKIKVEPSTTYYILVANYGSNVKYIAFYDKDQNLIENGTGTFYGTEFETPSNCYYIDFAVEESTYGQTYNHDICINVSNSAINGQYFAYEKHELAIPSGARVKYGINDSCYDYIECLSNGKKYKHNICGIVDLSTLSWVYNNDNGIWVSSYQTNMAFVNVDVVRNNILASNYTSVAGNNIATTTNSIIVNSMWWSSVTQTICVNNGSSTTQPSGELIFELATPTVTDISGILIEQHLPIQPLGTLTMVNTDKNAVPSSVTYDNGLVEVVKSNHEHDIDQQKEIDKLKSDKQDKLTAGSGITISGNTISADGVVKYKNILRLIDTSTGNPVFEFAKVGNTALYDEQAFENLTATNVLNYLDNIGDTYDGCAYIVVGGEERDFVQVDKTGTTDLFEVVYQGLIGIKHNSSNLELTVCFLDSSNDTVIDTANIGDDNSTSYYFVGKSEEV